MGLSLPFELWLDILSLAVHVPRTFDTKWSYTSDELIWEGVWAAMVPMENESLETRKAIIRVSHEWRRIGRRFLYEDLVVHKRETIANLATLFERGGNCASAEAQNGVNGNEEAGHGRWVRRVSIGGDDLFKEDIFPNLERLLKHCPNIQIILLNISPHETESFPKTSRLFQSLDAHSLRRLSLPSMGLPRATIGPPLFVPSTVPASLDWISLPSSWILETIPHATKSRPPASFLNLSVLQVNNHVEIAEFPSWDLPNLRYFSIDSLTSFEIQSFIPFMAANGHRLLGLSFGTNGPCPDLQRFLEYTPALQSLVFSDLDLNTLRPPETVSYPSITHIGLANINYDSSLDTERIEGGLNYILGRNLFPHLRTVRILVDTIPEQLDDDWEQPIAIAAQYGIRLEDRNRSLLRYEVPEEPLL